MASSIPQFQVSNINLDKKHSIIIYPYKNSISEEKLNGIYSEDGVTVNRLRLQFPIVPSISLKFGSRYEDFFESGAGGSINNMLNAVGLSAQFKWASVQVWKESDTVSLTLPIKLVAYENAQTEIYAQCLEILAVMSPDISSSAIFETLGILSPPGPNIFESIIKNFESLLGETGLKKPVIRKTITKTNKETGEETTEPEDEATFEARKKQQEINNKQIDELGNKIGLGGDNLLKKAKELAEDISGNNGETLNIRVGNFLLLKKMILTNATINWGLTGKSQMPMNELGFPMMATLSLSFEGTEIWTQNMDTTLENPMDISTNIQSSSSDGQIQLALERTGTIDKYVKDSTGNYISTIKTKPDTGFKSKASSIYKKFLGFIQ
jgi:hypothetical protein